MVTLHFIPDYMMSENLLVEFHNKLFYPLSLNVDCNSKYDWVGITIIN
jgi:hypothetical protein